MMGSNLRKGSEATFPKARGFRQVLGLLGAVIVASVLAAGCATPGGGGAEIFAGKGGLKEVAVFVELEKPAGDSQGIHLKQIQTDIEMKLRQAGMKVAPQAKASYTTGLPIIYVNVAIAKCDTLYAYNADIIYIPTKAARAASGKGTLATSGMVPDISQVRPKVGELVDRFIRDYLSV